MVGRLIRERREELRITQEDLGIAITLHGFNVSRSTISSWELERCHFPVRIKEARLALARALKLSEEEIAKAGDLLVETDFSENALKAASIIDRLTEETQETAIIILSALEQKQGKK